MGGNNRRLLEAMGYAMSDLIESDFLNSPNNSLSRVMSTIVYKDNKGKRVDIMDLTKDLDIKNLSLRSVVGEDGIIKLETSQQKTIFITKTPEQGWIRIWFPINQADKYDVNELLSQRSGLQSVPFEKVEQTKIEIGGEKVRELCKKAIYFELNTTDSKTEERFPMVDRIVSKYSSKNYGQEPKQPKLPTL